MARAVCEKCHRPLKVCICGFIEPVENRIEVGIFQHPSEVKQIKGTAIIANLSLHNCPIWVGENLSEIPELQAWLNSGEKVLLLYPPTEDTSVSTPNLLQTLSAGSLKDAKQAFKVLVLDGTWRKTFKMMQLNPELQALDRIALEPAQPSSYKVRKQKDDGSLSTIEAITELLSQIEGPAEHFQGLLDAFEKMQKQQLAFRKQD